LYWHICDLGSYCRETWISELNFERVHYISQTLRYRRVGAIVLRTLLKYVLFVSTISIIECGPVLVSNYLFTNYFNHLA